MRSVSHPAVQLMRAGVSQPAQAHLLLGHSGLQLSHVCVGQLDPERAQVLLQVLDVLGAGDRDDVGAARLQRKWSR